MCRSIISPLDAVDTTFRLLATGPQPLALDGDSIGMGKDSIALWELRSLLFHPATGVGLQRAALVQLVRRARQHRGAWMIGLVGVLLPGLRDQVTGLDQGQSRGAVGSGGMALVKLLERLDDPDMSNEVAVESLLWAVVRPPTAPARPARRRRLAAVPGRSR